MSNKIGLILALVIFLESYLFMYDLYMVQLVNSKLVMSSNYVNALIIKEGGVNEEIYTYVEDEVNGKLYLDSDNNVICVRFADEDYYRNGNILKEFK